MKNDLSLIFDEVYKALDSSCDKVLAKATDLNGYCQAKRQIHKIEKDLEVEFREIGILAYEMYKLKIDYDFQDFENKFKKISLLQKELKEIKINETSLNDFHKMADYDKNLMDKKEDKPRSSSAKDQDQMTRCKACGKANPIYVAYCSSCGQKME
ncbi:MAG: hypothetical protein Q4E36_06520 [Bacillota bacterium]|nr:hypothetical protein [Bacillota bacterium]